MDDMTKDTADSDVVCLVTLVEEDVTHAVRVLVPHDLAVTLLPFEAI